MPGQQRDMPAPAAAPEDHPAPRRTRRILDLTWQPASHPTLTVEAGRPGPWVTMASMQLPVMPPVAPMLSKAVPRIPEGPFSYEPKWDGFRSIVFRDGDEVEIGSRNERPMTRYFPEVVEAVRANLPERCVVDGEIVLVDPERGALDFEALQLRLHPAASRVRLL